MSHPRPCCGLICYCDGEDSQASLDCVAECDCDQLPDDEDDTDHCFECGSEIVGGSCLWCDDDLEIDWPKDGEP